MDIEKHLCIGYAHVRSLDGDVVLGHAILQLDLDDGRSIRFDLLEDDVSIAFSGEYHIAAGNLKHEVQWLITAVVNHDAGPIAFSLMFPITAQFTRIEEDIVLIGEDFRPIPVAEP